MIENLIIILELVVEYGFLLEEYNYVVSICGDRELIWLELGIFSVMWSEYCFYKFLCVYLK